MNYMELKAWSEVAESYRDMITRTRTAGLDSPLLVRVLSMIVLGLLCCLHWQAQRRYDRGFTVYLAALPKPWNGPSGGHKPHTQRRTVRAT